MLNVVIDRKTWGRGKITLLRNRADGLQCCLGFACLAAGATEDEITGWGEVDYLVQRDYVKNERFLERVSGLLRLDSADNTYYSNETHNDLVRINDSMGRHGNITEEKREADIIELGKKADINFSFVD